MWLKIKSITLFACQTDYSHFCNLINYKLIEIMKKIFFLISAALICISGCSQSKQIKTKEADTLKQELRAVLADSTVKVIDVRTPKEFASGHALNSINYPIENLEDSIPLLNKEDKIVVVCRSGNRSAKATKTLKEKGFSSVYDAGKWQNIEELKKGGE